jgi:hypothetical protein
MRLSGAIRGEGEAAERLGLNLSDAAVAAAALDAGITDWSTPGAISEAEKAAFRYQLVLEQTAQSVGAAADAADTAGGGFRQFINSVDDAAESLGGFLGPVGEVAAEFAPILIALPVAGAGLGRLGAAFTSTAAGARAAALGVGALRLALGPVGLIVTGLVAIGGSLFKSWMDQKEAAQEYDAALQDLGMTLETLRRRGDEDLAAAAENAANLAKSMKEAFEAAQPSKDDFEEGLGGVDNPLQAYSDAVLEFNKQYGELGESVTAITANITDALQDPMVNAEAYIGFVNRWLMAANLMPGTMDDIAITSMLAGVELHHFSTAVDESAAAVEELDKSFGLLAIDTFGQIRQAQEINREYAELTKNVEAFEDATQEWLGNGDNILDFWLQYQEGIRGAWSEYGRLKGAAMEAGTGLPAMPGDSVTTTEQAFEATVRLADALADAGSELDSVLATYQQIDDLGQRSAAAGSIADNLIGEPGVWATIDDLLANGAISLNTYNEALSSGVAIQESNVRVQEDLNAIRAAQLPLLAEAQVAYEANIDRISKMGAEEQRLTLALQDSSMQAQIAAQYATAYSASLGEIPPEVATRMIVEAAEADPMLKEILLNLGLISETEGVISVSFPDGPTVQETVVELTRSIDALITQLGGIPPIHLTADTADAQAAIDTVQADADIWGSTNRQAILTANNSAAISATAAAQSVANAFGNTTATATLSVNDAASGAIRGAIALAAAFNGMNSTATITTVYRTIGGTGAVGPTQRHGGMPGFAHGGTVVPFWGAEAGAELMHFAGGGTMPIYGEGVHFAPANTYVSPANANPGLSSSGGGGVVANFNNYAPIYGVDDLNDRFRDFAVSIRDDLVRHQTAQGVMA